MLDLLSAAGYLVTVVWMGAGLVVLVQRERLPDCAPNALARRVWAELRSVYLPAVAVRAVGDVVDASIWHAAGTAVFGLLGWWIFKDVDDDDRWKRRREKAAATVRQVGARLTVAPVPAAGGA